MRQFAHTVQQSCEIRVIQIVAVKMEISGNVFKLGECDAQSLAQAMVKLVAFQDYLLLVDPQKQWQCDDKVFLALLDE